MDVQRYVVYSSHTPFCTFSLIYYLSILSSYLAFLWLRQNLACGDATALTRTGTYT